MFSYIIFIGILCINSNVNAQNATINPQINAQNNSATHNRTFIPADVYMGEKQPHAIIYNNVGPTTNAPPPVFLDATAKFINETRSVMATGICYTEIPTSTLTNKSNKAPVSNGTTPGFSSVQVCCEGYQRNPHIFARCDPICKDDCPNGICTAPNTCVCMPNHVLNHLDECIATCPIGCGNGVCGANNECKCKPGFILEPNEKKYCKPNCEPACQFGKCVAPNKCACSESYHLNKAGACEPKCDNCVNGKCTAPNNCVCDTGYIRNSLIGVCEPICTHGCTKGRCIKPDVCECDVGFDMDQTGFNCVPHCDQPCLNGVCDGNNKCACNSGYILSKAQRNVCIAHCPQGCPNGFCSGPNFCICKPGFIKKVVNGQKSCEPV